MAKRGGGEERVEAPGGGDSLEVSFEREGAPPPAFASVCVVHRFPEYVVVDFGSIDPLRMEPAQGGGHKATLQHVGRVCLPESAARRLMADLARIYGPPS